MRIVHTCLRYPPATGGVETYVKEIVERTRQVPERDVRVLTSNMRTHGPISELDPNLLLDDPMYVQRLHHIRTPIFSYPRLQALNYYISHHQPDILESYSFWYHPADSTARYARRHNIPFIFHPIYYTRHKATWKLYEKTIGRATFAAADVVAVISPFEQQLIEQAGLPAKRFELIPPGIDATKFDHPRLNPFLKQGLTGNILLAVSRLAPSKGLDEIIDALPAIKAQFPNTHLVIIGEDFGERSKLETQVQRLGLTNSVHFMGRVEDHELVEWHQHADVLVHPSHSEAFGIVVAESLAAGTPVVARNVGSIPFVAPHEQVSLLFSTADELTQHILSLLADKQLRERLGTAGAKHVRQKFTWDSSVSKLLSLYDELLRK